MGCLLLMEEMGVMGGMWQWWGIIAAAARSSYSCSASRYPSACVITSMLSTASILPSASLHS